MNGKFYILFLKSVLVQKQTFRLYFECFNTKTIIVFDSQVSNFGAQKYFNWNPVSVIAQPSKFGNQLKPPLVITEKVISKQQSQYVNYHYKNVYLRCLHYLQ